MLKPPDKPWELQARLAGPRRPTNAEQIQSLVRGLQGKTPTTQARPDKPWELQAALEPMKLPADPRVALMQALGRGMCVKDRRGGGLEAGCRAFAASARKANIAADDYALKARCLLSAKTGGWL